MAATAQAEGCHRSVIEDIRAVIDARAMLTPAALVDPRRRT
jgi:hypothetical protein